MTRLEEPMEESATESPTESEEEQELRLNRATAPSPRAGADPSQPVFRIWLLVYGIVGAQMGWILRPFIGSPDMPWTFFRERESNFFEAVVRTLGRLFGS